jgi:hypothetical protein
MPTWGRTPSSVQTERSSAGLSFRATIVGWEKPEPPFSPTYATFLGAARNQSLLSTLGQLFAPIAIHYL